MLEIIVKLLNNELDELVFWGGGRILGWKLGTFLSYLVLLVLKDNISVKKLICLPILIYLSTYVLKKILFVNLIT